MPDRGLARSYAGRMSHRARDAVLAAVRDHGPISFAEFMEIALYGPGGFYETPPVGEHGHFVTSPHVHPIFGRLVGEALRSMWESLGRPAPFRVIEVGAGDGTLAAQIIDSLRDVPKSYLAVERSPGPPECLPCAMPDRRNILVRAKARLRRHCGSTPRSWQC